MRSQERPEPGDYAQMLADQARKLQREARTALDQGDYARATALMADAELLAEDVHMLVRDFERCEMCDLTMLAAYDVREAALPPPPRTQMRKRMRLTFPSRRLRVAIGASLVMSLALTEW